MISDHITALLFLVGLCITFCCSVFSVLSLVGFGWEISKSNRLFCSVARQKFNYFLMTTTNFLLLKHAWLCGETEICWNFPTAGHTIKMIREKGAELKIKNLKWKKSIRASLIFFILIEFRLFGVTCKNLFLMYAIKAKP